MATIKPQIPSAQVFTSDPLEHVYASQLPTLDGIAYMYLHNAQQKREEGAQSYMQGVDKANQMAMALGQMEEQNKLRQEQMKGTVDLIKSGSLPSHMNLGSSFYSNIPGGDTDIGTIGDLRRSEMAKNYASAAGVGGDSITQTNDVLPGVSEPVQRVVVKSKNPDQAMSISQAQVAKLLAQQKSNTRPLTSAQQQQRDRLDKVQ